MLVETQLQKLKLTISLMQINLGLIIFECCLYKLNLIFYSENFFKCIYYVHLKVCI